MSTIARWSRAVHPIIGPALVQAPAGWLAAWLCLPFATQPADPLPTWAVLLTASVATATTMTGPWQRLHPAQLRLLLLSATLSWTVLAVTHLALAGALHAASGLGAGMGIPSLLSAAWYLLLRDTQRTAPSGRRLSPTLIVVAVVAAVIPIASLTWGDASTPILASAFGVGIGGLLTVAVAESQRHNGVGPPRVLVAVATLTAVVALLFVQGHAGQGEDPALALLVGAGTVLATLAAAPTLVWLREAPQ